MTRGLTRKLEHRIELLYPATRYSVIRQTERYLIRTYIAALLVIAGLFVFAEFSIYYGCLAAVIVYVMISSHINTELAGQELRLLGMMEEFVSEVHFNYQFNGMLYESVEKAIEKVPYEMAIHGEIILSYLKNAYRGGGDDYRDIAPNSLFLTFYSLSLTVLNYGDKTERAGSVYLKNLGYLKESINIEILKRKRVEGQFAGLSAVAILPVFSIKLIEAWALSNMPELREAYQGFTGTLTTIAVSLVTVGIYRLIMALRTPYRTRGCKSAWVERLAACDIADSVVMFIIRRTYKSSERLNRLLKSVVYPYDIKEFVLRRIVFSAAVAATVFSVSISIGMAWWGGVLMAAVSGVCTYEAAYMVILIKRRIMIMDSEEEIVRYQSVILMLMHMDRITIEQILVQMRSFAVIFREEADRMTDRFSYMGMRIFEEIKEKTGFMPLEKLMDGFLATDALGIEAAFSGMEEERRYYVEKHRQDNDEIIMKKAAAAKVMAFIPMCLVILIKLILPFVIEGMRQLSGTGMK